MTRMLALQLMALTFLLQVSGSDAYCDDIRNIDNNIIELRNELKNISAEILKLKEQNKKSVAFNVHFSRSDVNVGENASFKFDVVAINSGNGYNPLTGVFTAPESGFYILYLSIMNSPTRGHIEAAPESGFYILYLSIMNSPTRAHIEAAPESGFYILYLSIMNSPTRTHIEAALNVNGSFKCYAHVLDITLDDGFCFTVTHLSKGHAVFAQRIYGGTYVQGGVWTNFGGALVRADN